MNLEMRAVISEDLRDLTPHPLIPLPVEGRGKRNGPLRVFLWQSA